MADFDLSTVTAALAQNLQDEIVKTANRQSVLLSLVPGKEGEGKNVAWDYENDGANAENHTDGQDVSSYAIDDPGIASLSWGLYRSNFKITDLAASAAASSRSPKGLMNAVGESMMNSIRKLASGLNAVGYSGAGTGTTIFGLAAAIKDDNTYGGVDRASVASMRSLVVNPGSLTDITLALIRSDLSTIYDNCGETPDIALCSSAVWNKIAALFTEIRRINQTVDGAGRVVLDGSANEIVVDGCRFLKDKDCTANAIYYLNTNYLYWANLPMESTDDMELIARVPLQTGFGTSIVQGNIFRLARTGAARKFTIQTQSQLVVKKPKAMGKRLNVAT